MRCLLIAALIGTFAIAACGDGTTGPAPYLAFATQPDSITTDTHGIAGDIVWYSYVNLENNTTVLATVGGAWSGYAPYGWTPDWRVPPTNWYPVGPRVSVRFLQTEDTRTRVEEYVAAAGDNLGYVRLNDTAVPSYYFAVVELDRDGLFTSEDGGDVIPARAPYIDVLYEYRSRTDLFQSVDPPGVPATLMRPVEP